MGNALLGRILADAAQAGKPVGLMTDRAANVPFSERAGFALVAHRADGLLPWWSFRSLMGDDRSARPWRRTTRGRTHAR